jgi:hypothetical protein
MKGFRAETHFPVLCVSVILNNGLHMMPPSINIHFTETLKFESHLNLIQSSSAGL